MSTKSADKKNSYRISAYNSLNNILINNGFTDLSIQKEISKNKNLNPKDISLLNETVYGIVRNKTKIDYICSKFIKKPVSKEQIQNLIRIGTYELLFLKGVKEHASIYETVELAKKIFGQGISKFINGVLRNIQRHDNNFINEKELNNLRKIEINESFPMWMIKYWNNKYDLKKTESICSSLNKVPNLTVRANILKTDRNNLLELLRENNINCEPTQFSDTGINLIDRMNPSDLLGYKEGLLTVQDEAAQLISQILAPKKKDKILDACSAPGGKSTHLAELTNDSAEILSSDINQTRLNLVEKQIKRLSLNSIKTIKHDLTNREFAKKYENYFDKILLDAPCSGLGTIRRNPDLKWNRKEEQISDLADLQLKILNNLSSTLKAGGKMVYSVCTISEKENENIISRFLEENSNFVIENNFYPKHLKKFIFDNNFFISYPDQFDMDGFFAVKLKRLN